MIKIKEFIKKYKSVILKLLLIVAIIGAIAGLTYLILRLCGFTTLEDFTRLRNNLGDNIGFWAIIVVLQIVQAVFIQLSNSLITAPISILFNNELWKVFLASWIGVAIGNIILYFIGRFAGDKLLKFVLGDKEKAEKMKEFMRSGKGFYIVGCVCPFIPSDVLNTLSGCAKYNPIFVIIATIITRGICVATTTWVVGLIPQYPWMIAVLVVLIIVMLLVAFFTTKRAIKRNKEKHEKEIEKQCPFYVDDESSEFNEYMSDPEAIRKEHDE